VRHDFTRGRGRWAACLTAAALAGTGLCGCANFWDDVTSRDFKVKSLWTPHPDPLVVLRDSTDGNERARALQALQEPKQHGGTDQQQEVVLRILATAAVNEPQPWCRLAAVQSLGRFKDPRAVTALKAAYDQANNMAPSEIQQVGYQPARGFLPETAAALRCHALAALGQTQNPAAVDLLVRVVRQPPVEGTEQDRQEAMDERITAARALGKFNQPEATEALLKVLQTEKDVALRDRAADALQEITGKKLPADAKAWEEALHPAAAPNGKPAPAQPKKTKFLGLF
jgi:hypothetical protein